MPMIRATVSLSRLARDTPCAPTAMGRFATFRIAPQYPLPPGSFPHALYRGFAAMNRRQFVETASLVAAGLWPWGLGAADAAFPSVRTPPARRKFKSEAVEQVIRRVKSTIGNKELAWMFENCFPNTLDTTVDFGVMGRPARHLRDHRRYRRHVAPRQHGPGLALPAFDEGRPRPGATHRGSDQSPDPLHPQGPLRQRLLQGRDEDQRLEE